MIDLTQYMRAADASRLLGYAGASSLTLRCRRGEVPGATQEGGKIWYVPIEWIKKEIEIGQNAGQKVGKPRGHKH